MKQDLEKSKKSPVTKGRIYKFLTGILGTEVSNQVLVDIEFNENKEHESQLTILGRPPILGSSSKQMRHVTPYSFVEHIIKSKINNAKSKVSILQDLKEPLKTFASEQQGICLIEHDYQRFKDNIGSTDDFYYIKMSTIKNTARTVCYLINEDQILEKWNKVSNFNQKQKVEAQKNYTTKLQKFISYTTDNLQEAIIDDNTLNIACEALARFILTLFNQRLYTAFPEEGNTLNYEIRLYKNEKETQAPKNKSYEVLTHAEINDKLNSKVALDGKIRIVNNEGILVRKVIKALETIDQIIAKYNAKINVDNTIKEYNEKYNDKFSKFKIPTSISYKNELEKYNDNLDKSNITLLSHYHVAKHLYFVFDFKPLEEKVFVSAPKRSALTKITVFPSADGNKSAEYCIDDGNIYRHDQVNDAKGYNKKVIFRSEISSNDLLPLLTKKTLDHVYVSIMSFFEFRDGFSSNESYPKSILEAFSKLVAVAYGDKTSPNTFVNSVKDMCKDIKVFQDDIDTVLNTSSEVEAVMIPSTYDDSFELF